MTVKTYAYTQATVPKQEKRRERAVDNLTNVTVDNNETIDIFYFKLVTYR